MKNKKNNLFVVHGGIGDVLLWTPALKAFDTKPDLLFLYNTPDLKILSDNALVRRAFKIENKFQLLAFCIKNIKAYDRVFLNHLCGGDFLQKAVSYCSEIVVSNSPRVKEAKNILKKYLLSNAHDALQNYFLAHDRTPQLSISNFELKVKTKSAIELPSSFISVQLSAGNNKTPYKNWPVKHWKVFIDLLLKKYPDQKLVLLGDQNEVALADQITNHQNIISLAGKTGIDEIFDIISKSDFFIGLDGGLMHVAAAVGKATFTIWGGSSPVLYGYDKFTGTPHAVIVQELGCGPCSAWQNPNISKTSDPALCPDFACLYTLTPEAVFDKFVAFMNK